ncbi:uncharacterized protein Z519_05622 [Cladophialophora bantiana CBS 173.52]|uniref:Putative transcription factor kapC n=1 Tax=Cladophialophora bantiana (strain ATCC 10958 / CBS 173.52 / CDC B-1940 / NIH 8579) TaxID=1442370 RepID=A0A0D2EWQ7_CLAB1|nr:uncharacterized protein Z519_05622 [Cladophialophora bantiana CBS 173.52]KIW94306.1 hypothetical protein Z519_05622 [Cladophialophora bantiana CBS 173.52]
MDFGFVSSPSQSPSQSLFTAGQYFDSTSEGSSPNSPHQMSQMMFNNAPMQYDLFQYGATPASFYPQAQTTKIPVEYNSAAAIDQTDRRRRRSGSTSAPAAKDKETIPNMHLRRRAQNRASQRAFRERKEKHVKGLERQLEDLHEKHQDLLQSYTRQADEVTKLNGRIAELTAELNALRSCQDQSFSEMLMPDKFDKFDAFSTHDNMLYNGPDCYFDKNAVDLNSEFALHSFEDSL